MNIKTALSYMTVEKAIELESRRFFCNADETVNAISISSMTKQIPLAVKIMPKPLKREKIWWYCENCGASHHTNTRHNYCHFCGQRIDWSEHLKEKKSDSELIERASIAFPEVFCLEKECDNNDC